ncbi:hypothetical protein [Roseimicrobium sp. ORNL1]|uniref:hypothetical protein n=1 Tax=Roseimicrobium sp. ORNL1 TaxID=2711231 RepID=UPI0013E0F4CE|nr:hypothetical protein [Roseimicrobium sp. ORNL1]QIF05140.1 hypothetical protein G5S37_27705 [Roseimicrobium sp. ORNL1]
MKHFVKFVIIESDERVGSEGKSLAPPAYAECKSRWPQCFALGTRSMSVHLEEGDPVLEEIVTFLRQQGLKPQAKRHPTPSLGDKTQFFVQGLRTFDKEDISEAAFYMLMPQNELGDGGNHKSTTQMYLERGSLKKQPVGSIGTTPAMGCTDTFRKELEKAGFKGLGFREIVSKDGKPLPEPYWQLLPDTHMPALLNRIVGEDGNDYQPERVRETGCFIDDFYFPELLRFPANEVQAMGGFDFAATSKRFGGAPGRFYTGTENFLVKPRIIVSKAFREWSLGRKLKLEFYPVILE